VKVIVVDDDVEMRLLVAFILRTIPDTVRIVGEASDGEAAWALVQREQPDIVITDLVMPRLDGIELTRRIRQEAPHLSVILMSSYTEDAYRMLASDSGADAFVSKQVIDRSLIPAIMDVMTRRFRAGRGPLPPDGAAPSAASCPK
jgi:DNA-binding NarL/FixJ family response regulator